MAGREDMISVLKERVIPHLRNAGYKGSFPHFRRITKSKVNLMTFQFDRWGGAFCIEIANGNPAGIVFDNKLIEPKKMRAWDIHHRLRLGADSINSDYWFRYDRNSYIAVANDILEKLPLAEEWYKTNNF